MIIDSLGQVTPGTGGSAVNTNNATRDRANKCAIRADETNTGKLFIGSQSMDTTTLVGVVEILQPGERYLVNDEAQSNTLQLNALYIKAENALDKFVAAAYVR